MILRTPKGERPYILARDREDQYDDDGILIVPEHPPTRIKIRDLTERERMECSDYYTPRSDKDRSRGSLQFVYQVLKRCFLGFYESHPPRDEEGNPLPHDIPKTKGGQVEDSFLERMDPQDKTEIAMAIFGRTSLTEDELGKYERQRMELPERAAPDDQKPSSQPAPTPAADETPSSIG